MANNDVPAGWYPDPAGGASQRYWDGAAWTAHTAPAVGPPQPPWQGSTSTTSATQELRPPADSTSNTGPFSQPGPTQQNWHDQQGWGGPVGQQPWGGQVDSGRPPGQKKKWPWIVAAACAVLIIGAIASGSAKKSNDSVSAPSAPASDTSAPAGASPSAKTTTQPEATVAAPPATAPQSWSMPNLVGTGLQNAQDRIQALTGDAIFYTSSHDATGAGRVQILDADWHVCSQNIRAGSRITKDSQIDFGAVKLAESCP
jgi:hypothetical protein